MRNEEKEEWGYCILGWFVFVYIGYLFFGYGIFTVARGNDPTIPQNPPPTLEQLQETPCLGCQWFQFQQTSQGLQYCCRVKNINVLEHPSQCNQTSYCLNQGTKDFNHYTQLQDLQSQLNAKDEVYWSIFWKLNIFGLIIIGLFLIRACFYPICLSLSRSVRNYLNRLKRNTTSKDSKRNDQVFNEEMDVKTKSSDELEAAGQIKE